MRARPTITATISIVSLAFLALLSTGTYTIQRGDTLAQIARRHGTTVSALVAANGIANPDRIYAGQTLVLGAGGTTATGGTPAAGGATHHVVSRGETIAGIARRYGISQQQLVEANGLVDGRVYAGQRLALQGSGAIPPGGGSSGGTTTYTVRAGDALGRIASRHGTTVKALQAANNIANPHLIRIGQQLSVPASGAAAMVCPVPGGAKFMNDWGFPRSGGRFHAGNDLFAPRGRPVVAVVAGSAVRTSTPLGGNQVKLAGDDGVHYYFTHLDSYGAHGRVNAGDVIGYVGNTGNAIGGPTHLHFEVHPGGGPAVNPYPRVVAACR